MQRKWEGNWNDSTLNNKNKRKIKENSENIKAQGIKDEWKK